ncbi:hypothetical protein A2U01_0095147, partial [Trifolium medium]|nr:hypothetical protein [Trifolium medium]
MESSSSPPSAVDSFPSCTVGGSLCV